MISLLLLCLFYTDTGGIKVSVNEQEAVISSTVFLKQGDQLDLYTEHEEQWVIYKPTFREYDNLVGSSHARAKIEYTVELLSETPSAHLGLKLAPGTHLIGTAPGAIDSVFSSVYPLHLMHDHVVQLVVRESDSYLGYLTELLGLPFVLPPRRLGVYGHQTDLRVGTDCAELAIYGARRMGLNIPYGGPRGILPYLQTADTLVSGTIIHYGFQVSVLYEDRGILGSLDEEDLLIHAYQDQVAIERLGSIALANKAYRLYHWKEAFLSAIK